MTILSAALWLAGCSLRGMLPAQPIRYTLSDATPDDAVLLAVGDIADCGYTEDEEVAALMAEHLGTIALLGDTVYLDGTAEEFAECFDPAWGDLRDRIRPTTGNHEYYTEGAQPYFDYFGSAAGEAGSGWYSYDLGEWHIVVLNSNCDEVGGCGEGSAQAEWLKADLEANTSQCILAYWHHPMFSLYYGLDDRSKYFWDLLYEHHAEVVLNGHDHHYVRFGPQTPDGQADLERGIRQFIVGTGGAPLYKFDQLVFNVEARDRYTHGILKMLLQPTGYEWQFIPTGGGDFTDGGKADCH